MHIRYFGKCIPIGHKNLVNQRFYQFYYTATRYFSLAIFFLFIGMIVTSHLEYGFFMNWFGTQEGEGYEYHILVLGMAAGLCLSGAGAYSVDRLLTLKMQPVQRENLVFAWQ